MDKAPLITRESFQEAFQELFRTTNGFIMSFPYPKTMNRCWPLINNPTEPKRGTKQPHHSRRRTH